uniref:Uncharacterized protein n=1 Tax=Anopheles funestus TaxID=62324 RepID=A0A4Y0BEW1_ANOFN
MIIKCVFSVLLLLVPRTESFFMRDSTCDMVKNQLQLIDDTINDAFRSIQSASSYTTYTVDERLAQLFSSYSDYLASKQQYEKQVSTFVEGKLKQFSIPANGLEGNLSQLKKIFSAVEDRNAFQRLQVVKQKRRNKISKPYSTHNSPDNT